MTLREWAAFLLGYWASWIVSGVLAGIARRKREKMARRSMYWARPDE